MGESQCQAQTKMHAQFQAFKAQMQAQVEM